MAAQPRPASTIEPPLVKRHWAAFRRAYALLWGVLVGGLYWLVPVLPEAGKGRVGVAVLAGGAVALATLSAFRLARISARRRMLNLKRYLDETGEEPGAPPFHLTGWEPFDTLAETVLNERHRARLRLAAAREETAHYRKLAAGSRGLEALVDLNGRLTWLNDEGSKLTGHAREECLGAPDIVELLVYSKDRQALREQMLQMQAGGEPTEQELRMQHKDGRTLWVACHCRLLQDEEGRVVAFRLSAQDIQRRKDAEMKLLEGVAALRRAQALKEHYLARSNDERMRLASLLDTVSLGILFVDQGRRVVYVNQPAIDIWQLSSRDAVIGARDTVLVDMTSALRKDDAAYRDHLKDVVSRHERSAPYDVMLADGRVIREVSTVVPSSDGTHAIGRVWVYEDVTEAHRSALRLTELAERDPLTGLYNRRRFLEEIGRQIADGQRRGECVGLLAFDLDGFKPINDSFGHQAGDEVLVTLSREISQVVRRHELFFRLGGDEFAVLASSTDEGSMRRLAQRVLAVVTGSRFRFDGQEASVTASLGIALAPHDAKNADGLMHAADRAMYYAKSRGKNRIETVPPLPEETSPK